MPFLPNPAIVPSMLPPHDHAPSLTVSPWVIWTDTRHLLRVHRPSPKQTCRRCLGDVPGSPPRAFPAVLSHPRMLRIGWALVDHRVVPSWSIPWEHLWGTGSSLGRSLPRGPPEFVRPRSLSTCRAQCWGMSRPRRMRRLVCRIQRDASCPWRQDIVPQTGRDGRNQSMVMKYV